MNDNYTQTEQLIRFIDGDLTTSEATLLEKELSSNRALQLELENLSSARLAVTRFGLMQQVGTIHSEIMNEFKAGAQGTIHHISSIRKIGRITMRIAAGLLLLVIGTGLYQYFTVSPESLFNEKYSSYTVGTSRSNAQMTAIEKLYSQKKYAELIASFEVNGQPTVSDHFYAGLSYLSTNDLEKAINNFSAVITKNTAFNTSELQDDTEYYMALTYLKQRDLVKALPIFEKIHADKLHLYQDKVGSWYLQQLRLAAWKK